MSFCRVGAGTRGRSFAGGFSPEKKVSFHYTPLEEYAEYLILVGKGKRPERCGKVVPALSCQACFKSHYVQYKCNLKNCPECYKDWIKDRTSLIVKELTHRQVRRHFRGQRLLHVVISPDPRLYDKPLHELRKYAINYIITKSNREIAGVLIFHAFRPNERYYQERGNAERFSDDDELNDLQKWAWIREQENWQDYVKFSPHFHFIGYVGWLEPPKRGEWFIYKTITNEKGKPRRYNRNIKGLAKLVYYLLTHATGSTIEKNFPTYSWIGVFSCRKRRRFFKRYADSTEKVQKHISLKCKDCGGPLVPLKSNFESICRVWLHINPKHYPYEVLREKIIEEFKYYRETLMRNLLEMLDDYFIDFKDPPEDKKYVIAFYIDNVNVEPV